MNKTLTWIKQVLTGLLVEALYTGVIMAFSLLLVFIIWELYK
jgi:NADH:ubiquinone oxidoreductase subunit 4 (subunit M)